MTDRELIEGCLKGLSHCEKALFDRFAGKMMALCLRYADSQAEAEDMMQDAFIKVFENLKGFRFDGSLEGWVRRIVVTTALRHIQRHRNIQDISVAEEFRESPDVPDAITQMGEQEILRLISELPHGYRLVFNLHVIEGYRHHEIAELLGIEESTSRSQLVKARKWLQDKFLSTSRLTTHH